MQSTAILTHLPSLPLRHRSSSHHLPVPCSSNTTTPRCPVFLLSSDWTPLRRSWTPLSPPPACDKLGYRPWHGFPLLHGARRMEARAASDNAGEGVQEKAAAGGLGKTLELGLLFGLWYFFNIYFNIYNKQVIGFIFFP